MRGLVYFLCIATNVAAYEICKKGFTYYEGQGCFHFGNEPNGLEWFESFYYCEQIGGFQVTYFLLVLEVWIHMRDIQSG